MTESERLITSGISGEIVADRLVRNPSLIPIDYFWYGRRRVP